MIERSKILYAKFINQTETSYVPVYLWKEIDNVIVGYVPEFPPGAEILPVTDKYIVETYGEFQSYIDENQFIKEIAVTIDTVYIYP